MESKPSKYDLKADWDRACARYLETTGQDPRMKTMPTPEQVVAQIQATRAKDAKDHEKIDRVKDVAGKTLECVMRLGTIAAQAASMVRPQPMALPETKDLADFPRFLVPAPSA